MQTLENALFVGPLLPAWLRRKLRQKQRAAKREERHAAYHRVGLNGKRAVMRRQRQIAAGRLQVSA